VTQPVLIGPRIRCEPLRTEHTDGVVATFTDPLTSRFLGLDLSTPEGLEATVRWRLSYDGPTHLGHWAFIHNGQVIGVGHLLPSRELSSDLIEIGWFLNPQHGRRGLATEAAGLLTDYALGEVGMPAIWALIHVDNIASQALAARLGYTQVGLGDHHGGPHGVHLKLPDLPRTIGDGT
jgi:RimJ/RimL family protein N-acetyltransferase